MKKSLPEKAITQIQSIHPSDFSADVSTLQREYQLAETINANHYALDDIDMIIVLSGRSGLAGRYLEDKNKYTLSPDAYDPSDTQRRIAYGIQLLKKCRKSNLDRNIKKPVYLYFNGVEKQNTELSDILKKEGAYQGLEAEFFIIHGISLDNTFGQVIGLNYFLHNHWPRFSTEWNLKRPPNLVFCTSTYHVPRVTLGIGENSPLLTAEFWKNHPEYLKQLSPRMQSFVLNPGDTLKRSRIMVLGCDRTIPATPFWEKDLSGDMDARINYSSLHRLNNFKVQQPPALANTPGSNIITLHHAKINLSFFYQGLTLCDKEKAQKTENFSSYCT